MGDGPRLDALGYLALWALIGLGAILVRILPLSLTPGDWPGPDVFAALTLAWMVRRPDHLPIAAIAVVFLIEDMFLMRPPGWGALVMVAGCEFLRRRASVLRELNLLLEWAMVVGVQVVMFWVYRFGLAIVMVPRPPLDLSLLELLFTLAAYPLAVLVLQAALRVSKPATGEVDERGRRL